MLAADGVAFIHHSNIGAYEPGTYDPHAIHWRATSVSADLVEQCARSVGLRCVSQETVCWGQEPCRAARSAPEVGRCDRRRARLRSVDRGCFQHDEELWCW